jgi:hypothetical protein
LRNPRSLRVLESVLETTDAVERDIVAITCKVLPPLTPEITPEERSLNDADRAVLTRVVNAAEIAGKRVYPLVIPTNNPLYAIACAARDLRANEVVLGTSQKSSTEVQLEHFALAWGMATSERDDLPLRIRIIGDQHEVVFEL